MGLKEAKKPPALLGPGDREGGGEPSGKGAVSGLAPESAEAGEAGATAEVDGTGTWVVVIWKGSGTGLPAASWAVASTVLVSVAGAVKVTTRREGEGGGRVSWLSGS